MSKLLILALALTSDGLFTAGFRPLSMGRYPVHSTKASLATFGAIVAQQDTFGGSSNTELLAEFSPDGFVGSIEFPAPLNKVDRFKRAGTFWLSAAPILMKNYGVLAVMKLREMHGLEMSETEIEEIWNSTHVEGAKKLAGTISDMKGFYVKAAQIVAMRGDLFPKQYTDALSQFTDNVDPMPLAMIKGIISQELLKDGEKFEDVFSEFDVKPLGAASIAQVHRAVLSEKYGSRQVAVKVQRPSIESKLMGDIANLKMIAKIFREANVSPVDYYTIFSELQVQLKDEFDFRAEASAMDSIYRTLSVAYDGSTSTELPVAMPQSVPELVTRRVLVMDFLEGNPLSRMQEKMESKGIKPGSVRANFFGKKLVQSLTKVFSRTILETGLFHADPHGGNIMITDDGNIGLIDFGQVKQLSMAYRQTIAKIIVELNDRKLNQSNNNEELGRLILELGVELHDDAKPEAAAAIAMWLFDGSVEQLPGGYDVGELSPKSPLREIKVFPQDLVLVARSAILIKAFSNRFNIRWSLAEEWAPVARQVLYGSTTRPTKPVGLKVRTWWMAQGVTRRAKHYAKGVFLRVPKRIRIRLATVMTK